MSDVIASIFFANGNQANEHLDKPDIKVKFGEIVSFMDHIFKGVIM